MSRVARLAAVALVVVAGVTAGVTSSIGTGAASASTSTCTVSSKMVPSCGAWFGEALEPEGQSLPDAVSAQEAALNRPLDIVHTFHAFHDEFPTAGEKAVAATGAMLFYDWGPRNGHGATPHWSTIASGAEDSAIKQEALRLKALKKPVMLAFSHEPEMYYGTKDEHGSPAQFVAAYRRVHKLFQKEGAYNVLWVWDMMGSPATSWFNRYEQYWPGDYFVDWVAWDPYNSGGCAEGKPWRSLTTAAKPFYDWLLGHGHGNKPFMLGEYGSSELASDPTAKAGWFNDIPTELQGMPKIKAMVYFNVDARPNRCGWQAASTAKSWTAFKTLSNSGPFAASEVLHSKLSLPAKP
jgi:hypothetical protein